MELVAARDNFDRKLIEAKQEYEDKANELMSTTDTVPGVPGFDYFETEANASGSKTPLDPETWIEDSDIDTEEYAIPLSMKD